MSAHRPGLVALFVACLAMISQLALTIVPASSARLGAGLQQVHICSVGQPQHTPERTPHHRETNCPACPVCTASMVQAVVPSLASAVAVPPVVGDTPQPIYAPDVPPSARRSRAAMPRGPPALT